jgi:hypothetical protein
LRRCVLCLREPDRDAEQTWLTDAHVIPESVGGRLSAPFLCRRCNSQIGAEVEAPLVSDRPRPVKWCTKLSAPSSPDIQAAAAIAITSSGSSAGGASAFAIDSALM